MKTKVDEWRKRSRCAGLDTEAFYVTDEAHPTRHLTPDELSAIAVCNKCPVSGNCLNQALEKKEKGIWGGMTTRQRNQLKRSGIRRSCARCGSNKSTIITEYQICLFCGLSKLI